MRPAAAVPNRVGAGGSFHGGGLVTKNPVSLSDMHATIMHLMGINPKTAFDVERRPFYVTQDGKGQPVMDVIA